MHRWIRGATSTVALAAGVAACGGSVAGQAGPFEYAPGTHRYRLTTIVNRTQDQAGGRAPFEFTVTTTQYVTLDLTRRSRDTLAMALSVDSVGITSTLDALPPDTEGIRGVTLHGAISPQGRVYTFEPPAGTPPGKVSALYRAFRPFLVPFPSPHVSTGMTWTDTTTEVMKKDPFKAITTAAVTTWKVTGDTTYTGQLAWRVERNAVVTTTGDGVEGTTPVHLAGDESIRGVRYVSQNGVYLGGNATQSSQIQMSMTGTGEGAPIKQNIRSTVELLPTGRTTTR